MRAMAGCCATDTQLQPSAGNRMPWAADALRLYAPIAKENGKTITGLLRGEHDAVACDGGYFPGASDPGPDRRLGVSLSPIPTTRAMCLPCGIFTRSRARTTIPRTGRDCDAMANLRPATASFISKAGFNRAKSPSTCMWSRTQSWPASGLLPSAILLVVKALGRCHCPCEAGVRRGHLAERPLAARLSLPGLNGDEDGGMALDGVLAHVAGAGRGSFNYRFAQPSRDAQPTSSISFPTDIFPFTDLPETDPAIESKKTKAGLLESEIGERALPRSSSLTLPTNIGAEPPRSLAFVPDPERGFACKHLSIDGMVDAKISPDVRIYFTGLQHFPAHFPRGREPETWPDNSHNRRCRSSTSGAP